MAKEKSNKLVEHHVIYALPDQKKRQGDLTMFITEGFHTVITDVMYSTKLNDRMAGWALIFEGLKRLMRSDIEKYNKERGLKCQTPKPETTGSDTKAS